MSNDRIIFKMASWRGCGKNQYYSNTFPIQNGLKQGDYLSPPFFKFALECIIRKA